MKSIKSIIATVILILFVTGSLQLNFDIGNAELITGPGSIAIDNQGADPLGSLTLCGKLEDASYFIWFKIEASDTLRVFTFDTCDVTFDSVIGVFSGPANAGLNDLTQLGCNDDRDTPGSLCGLSTSLLQYISVSADETVYIVIGGYTAEPGNPTGTGHLQISIADPSDLECSADVIIQVRSDLEDAVESSKTTITTSIESSFGVLGEDINNAQTAVITAIATSESTLSGALGALQTTVGEVGVVLDGTAATVGDISSVLSNVNDNVDAALSKVNTEIDANIDSVSTAIQTLSTDVDDSFTALDSKVAGVQTTAGEIDATLTQLNTVASDIQTQQTELQSEVDGFKSEVSDSFQLLDNNLASTLSNLQTANNDLTTIDGDITDVNTRVNDIKSSVEALSTEADGDFTALNTNIDEATTIIENILSVANDIVESDATIAQQNVNTIAQITSFSSEVDGAFTDIIGDVGAVTDAVEAVDTSIQSSFSLMQTKIADIQNINNDIDADVIQINTVLGSLSGELQADSAQSIFINTVVRYLSDSNTPEPLSLRIPNAFGGRLDDVSAYVVSQFDALKNAATLVGEKGSPDCAASASCTFFFNVAEPSYTTSFAKFNAFLNARRFSSAFIYLRQAFISLYPFGL